MWPFTKKVKKIRALVVVNEDPHVPIDYCNKIDVDIETEVRAAANALAISMSADDIAVIVYNLASGNGYCYTDPIDGHKFGFDIVTIEV